MLGSRCSARVHSLVTELDVLHKEYLRRSGDPQETKKQSQFLLSKHLDDLVIDDFDEPALGRFAAQASSTLAGCGAESSDRLTQLFRSYLVGNPQSRGTLSRVAEAHLQLGSNDTDALSKGYERAVQLIETSASSSAVDYQLAGDIERTLRVGAAVFAPSFDFSSNRHGAGPSLMLPTKNKLLMNAKLQRVRHGHRLMLALRQCSLNRIDALRLIRTFSVEGFFDETVLDHCCTSVERSKEMLSQRDMARFIFHTGVLTYKHPIHKTMRARLSNSRLFGDELHDFVVGSAMLKSPWDATTTRHVVDGIWRHSGGKKSATVPWDWHVDMMHALVSLNEPVHKYWAHAARNLITQIHLMDDDGLLKLYYAVRDAHKWNVDPDLRDSFRRVLKIEGIVKQKLATRSWTPAQRALVADATESH